jgi:hypothetical protein
MQLIQRLDEVFINIQRLALRNFNHQVLPC